MAKKEYSFYPGCSSERKASAANYMTSVETMCKSLDVKLNEIPDWNCCGTKETQERIVHSGELLADINAILADAGLKYEGKPRVRHMVEVLIEDLGYDELKKPVKKPLEGIKIAGYVGCQTNRPFGVAGESFENPKYLDKLTEMLYYSQLMSVAYGATPKEAGLDGNIIRATKLEEIAAK